MVYPQSRDSTDLKVRRVRWRFLNTQGSVDIVNNNSSVLFWIRVFQRGDMKIHQPLKKRCCTFSNVHSKNKFTAQSIIINLRYDTPKC